jgi:hypothetical protein
MLKICFKELQQNCLKEDINKKDQMKFHNTLRQSLLLKMLIIKALKKDIVVDKITKIK